MSRRIVKSWVDSGHTLTLVAPETDNQENKSANAEKYILRIDRNSSVYSPFTGVHVHYTLAHNWQASLNAGKKVESWYASITTPSQIAEFSHANLVAKEIIFAAQFIHNGSEFDIVVDLIENDVKSHT